MNNISQNKNLLLVIICLVLLDIAVLAYFLWPSPKKPHTSIRDRRRQEMVEKLKNDVGFSEQQVQQYTSLKDSQMNELKPVFTEMRSKKDSLFLLVSNGSATDSIAKRFTEDIAALQQQVDYKLYKTHVKLRELCSPQQLSKYDTMMAERVRKMSKQSNSDNKK